MEFSIHPIARMRSDFPTKFGIPRQSSLASNTVGKITFNKEFRNSDALKGLEGFSHLWLIWEFSANSNKSDGWSPLVRPPRLGGNTYMGVFATRSPKRPNRIGMSVVKVIKVEGNTIHVENVDILDGTPLLDIKPYVPQLYEDTIDELRIGWFETKHQKVLLKIGY